MRTTPTHNAPEEAETGFLQLASAGATPTSLELRPKASRVMRSTIDQGGCEMRGNGIETEIAFESGTGVGSES